MAKLMTKEMQAINSSLHDKDGNKRKSSPGREAWKRLKRNRTAIAGMVVIIVLLLTAVLANVIAPYDYASQDYTAISQLPSLKHPFGTDNMGRDIFSRCIYGTRYSLPTALVCIFTSLLVGGSMGFAAAYFGGRVDNVVMRIMDVFQSIPSTLMAIAVIAALGNGMSRLVLAITITFMPACAKTCRAAIFTVKGNEYIESARALGAGGFRLLVRHMIPNAMGPIIISAISMIAGTIMIVSTLSYLGLGVAPPTPEWGVLLSDGKEFLRSYPHMVVFPGLMIMITVFSFNLFGDGLRDALDPRLK